MSASGNWCLIESDPGVFSELIRGFGAEGVECEEVYDLKEIDQIEDAFGLIFLFKWDEKRKETGKCVPDVKDKGIFFAKQVFFQLFEFDEKAPRPQEDAYHFVSFIPINGVLYELDGLKEGPIDHGKIPEGTTWVDSARPVLERRMAEFSEGNFNLMAMVPERLSLFKNQLKQLASGENMPSGELKLELERKIETEKRKNANYREENNRRRHNYIPLIVELFKLLGEQGCLLDQVVKAKILAEQREKTKHSLKK